jgi:hypothetical protein
LAVSRISGPRDTAFGVLFDDYFGKRLESFSSGNYLGEDLRAICVFVDHSLNGTQLASYFAQANTKRLFLIRAVMMVVLTFVSVWHFRNIRQRSPKSANFSLEIWLGGGGMLESCRG